MNTTTRQIAESIKPLITAGSIMGVDPAPLAAGIVAMIATSGHPIKDVVETCHSDVAAIPDLLAIAIKAAEDTRIAALTKTASTGEHAAFSVKVCAPESKPYTNRKTGKEAVSHYPAMVEINGGNPHMRNYRAKKMSPSIIEAILVESHRDELLAACENAQLQTAADKQSRGA